MPVPDFVDRAVARVREVLADELAVVHAELEARVSEGEYRGSPRNVDPHHVTTALNLLRERGEIADRRGPTRGGGEVDTIELADRRRRGTAIDKAAAHKRILWARYDGWAEPTARYPRGRIGPAGEAAVRNAVLAAGTLIPATPGAGEVNTILGVTLRGPADSGGLVVPISTLGIPGRPVTILIEVKNTRSWVYPTSRELYQLLDKASTLQETHPDQPLVPVLICRRAHRTLFKMASQLGFFVIETERQWAGEVTDDELAPIRNELRFTDLHRGSDPSPRVQERFRNTLPEQCTRSATAWAFTCRYPSMTNLIHQLRDLTGTGERARTMNALRLTAEHLEYPGGW